MRIIVSCSLGREGWVACRIIRTNRLSSVKQAYEPAEARFTVEDFVAAGNGSCLCVQHGPWHFADMPISAGVVPRVRIIINSSLRQLWQIVNQALVQV